jgi:hypothetical protein
MIDIRSLQKLKTPIGKTSLLAEHNRDEQPASRRFAAHQSV